MAADPHLAADARYSLGQHTHVSQLTPPSPTPTTPGQRTHVSELTPPTPVEQSPAPTVHYPLDTEWNNVGSAEQQLSYTTSGSYTSDAQVVCDTPSSGIQSPDSKRNRVHATQVSARPH